MLRRDIRGDRLCVATWTPLLCAVAAILFSNQAIADQHDSADEPEKDTSASLPEDPLAPPELPQTAPGMMGLFGSNYWYLPYAVANEEQALAFLDAYEDALAKGENPGKSITVPEGKGAGGRDKLYRLREGVTDTFIANINNPAATAVSQADIPVVIAQPEPGASGANVLFMDGHVDFVPFGDFPVTEDIISALKEIDPPEYAEDEQ